MLEPIGGANVLDVTDASIERPISSTKIQIMPSDVVSEAGQVIVDGPDGVAVSLTPGAKVETGQRLIMAATVAFGDDAIERARQRLKNDNE